MRSRSRPPGTPSTTSSCSAASPPRRSTRTRAASRFEGGRELRADAILLATGAPPRRLPVTGSGLDGVLTLRTRADADALGARLRTGAPLAVIGAGWIGCEVAASARTMGCEVTVLEAGPHCRWSACSAPQLGERYRRRCTASTARTSAAGSPSSASRATATARWPRSALADGTRVEAATVVMGVGVAPRTELAQAAGLAVSDGIEVDARLRTAAPGVLAAGDVARAFRPRYGRAIRIEHWANAAEQGAAAARSMLGLPPGPDDDRCPTSSPTSTTRAWSTSACTTRRTRSC